MSRDRANLKNVVLWTLLAVLPLVTAWRLHRWSQLGRRPSPGEYVTFDLRCLSCGHEFRRKMGEMPPEGRAGGPVPVIDTAAVRVDCPSCGKPRSSAMLATCPLCRKPYVSAFTTAQPGKPPPTKDVCPHCGRDVMAGVPGFGKGRRPAGGGGGAAR